MPAPGGLIIAYVLLILPAVTDCHSYWLSGRYCCAGGSISDAAPKESLGGWPGRSSSSGMTRNLQLDRALGTQSEGDLMHRPDVYAGRMKLADTIG